MGVAIDLYFALFVHKFAVFTITLEDCMHCFFPPMSAVGLM
jgi:hypothetical protein